MNKVELVYEGHGKKQYTQNKIMLRCLILRNIINDRIVLEREKKN